MGIYSGMKLMVDPERLRSEERTKVLGFQEFSILGIFKSGEEVDNGLILIILLERVAPPLAWLASPKGLPTR